jgi:hypothetical protein
MLVYEPRKRISAREGLDHPYFTALPNPTHPSKLPKTAASITAADEDELEGKAPENAEGGKGVKVKARPPLKRKASALVTEEDKTKSKHIAKRLDFGSARSGSDVRSPWCDLFSLMFAIPHTSGFGLQNIIWHFSIDVMILYTKYNIERIRTCAESKAQHSHILFLSLPMTTFRTQMANGLLSWLASPTHPTHRFITGSRCKPD